MNTRTSLIAVPVVASTLLLGACGGKTAASSGSVATSTATSTSVSSSGATAGTTSTAGATTAAECPTSNTRSFAKTRFVSDIGLAAGTFHRYIYKPYQAGTFTKGASGRTTALLKAGTVALVDTKLVDNAYKNVQASPALCKALVQPLGELKTAMGGLTSDVKSGNLGAIASIEQVVQKVEGTAKANGAAVTENDSLSSAESAQKQG